MSPQWFQADGRKVQDSNAFARPYVCLSAFQAITIALLTSHGASNQMCSGATMDVG